MKKLHPSDPSGQELVQCKFDPPTGMYRPLSEFDASSSSSTGYQSHSKLCSGRMGSACREIAERHMAAMRAEIRALPNVYAKDTHYEEVPVKAHTRKIKRKAA